MDQSSSLGHTVCPGATITEYWNERAKSYSNEVNGELVDERHGAWEAALARELEGVLVEAALFGNTPRVADLGCGPGFFSALLAEMECEVDAIDASPDMLELAKKNVDMAVPGASVTFHESDLLTLPFEDNTFDACVSRNVTWLMRDPKAAYAEWLRVLRPGGKLVVFDANWYRYLVDPDVDAKRREDQKNGMPKDWDPEAQATSVEEKRCEDIAATLPLTSVLRPQWDLDTLSELGVRWAHADEDVWRRLWTASEQAYYASSPLFVVEAVK